MSFDREKRRMLTWLLMLGPLPLPFNEILEWPVLFLYEVALVYYLQRVEQGRPPLLPNWFLNVLGLVYLPILAVDLRSSLVRGRPMAALLHLIMFLAAVKLFSLRREKEKWLMLVAAFFLFIGSMATSTHVSVALYLLSFSALLLLVLVRFAYLHMLTVEERHGLRREPAEPRPLRLRSPLAGGVALIVAVAVPTFATLPRLRDPYLMGPGGGVSLVRSSGFSDSVDLSLTSSIRNNREVALRLDYLSGEAPPAADLRLRGTTFDVYENGRWQRRLEHSRTVPSRSGIFEIASGEVAGEVEVFRAVINSRSLPLPIEATALDLSNSLRVPQVALDLGGAVYLPRMIDSPVRYKVRVDREPRFAAELEPAAGGGPYTALDQRDVGERLRRLARQVMGEGSDAERAARLEQHLLTGYAYTTNFVGREGKRPVEEFLFTHRSGHCELFASAMVLMLRTGGIPARFVTGFLGAEFNPIEGYFIVRQENAHAWVEAYIEGVGWRVYDPTPPEGRPSQSAAGLLDFFGQLYDYLYFRWDRYVLTFGADDQERLFAGARERLASLWKRLSGLLGREEGSRPPAAYSPELGTGEKEIRQRELWLATKVPTIAASALFLGALAVLLVWHRRRPLDAGAAYRRLRRLLGRAGLAVTESLAPLELERLAAARFPSAAGPARRLVELYLRESFAEAPLAAAERTELLPALRELDRAVRDDRKRERKRPKL